MRKLLLLTVTALFIFPSIHAQSYNSSLNFQKNQYSVAAVQVPFTEDVVTAAVKDYMSRKGFKDSHYKDFVVFRSVPLDSRRDLLSDAYFNINRKSHSEKDLTIINLLPVKKGQTLSPASAEDSSVSASLGYLNNLKPFILHYSVQQEILAQQKVVGKAQARLIRLKNDSGDIAKKIRSAESDLNENKNDQDKKRKEILSTPTGDHVALAKAQKKMDKLLNKQADYEKKARNAQADANENNKDLQTQQNLFNKESQALDALKLKQQNIAVNP